MKFRNMAALALAGAMTISLAACGGSSSDSATSEDAAEVTTDAAADDTAGSGDATYSIGVVQLVQHEALDAATEGFADALTEELGDAVDIDIQVASGEKDQCATIANTFVSEGKDLIMANATPALQAAQTATADIPIVGTSVTDYATALDIADWTGTTGINVTGYSDLAPLDEQAQLLSEWFPVSDYPTVGILYCSAEPNSKYQSDVITESLEKLGYTVEEFTFSDSNDLASVTTNASQNANVLYIPTDNTCADNTENIRNVLEPAGIPAIVGEEGICAGCGVATLSISYYDMGYQAGKMAADILRNGTDPATMEVGTVDADGLTKKYNAEIVDALGIETPELSDYEKIETE